MPPFGLKTDAVPGRINETWTYVPAEFAGQTFYGQCSELCGTGHAFMPIMIKMVSKEEFQTWTEQAREEFAQVATPALPSAPAETLRAPDKVRSEEHTSELQSLMRNSYAVFCMTQQRHTVRP